ncbi:glycosyltransferase [Phycicoccus ginsengisoli]
MGGVTAVVTETTSELRSRGVRVRQANTASLGGIARAIPYVWERRSVHVLHITRLWRSTVLAPLFAVLPGTTVLVLHSGSARAQLAGMPALLRHVVLTGLRAYQVILPVNGDVVSELPAGLRRRATVVVPRRIQAVGRPGPGTPTVPHRLAVATNSGLPHYRAAVAVRAAELVRRSWPDAELVILAYDRETPALQDLRRQVAELPWVRVEMNLSEAAVREELEAAEVFLRPTSWDGDALIVREALMAGARVVASDTSPRPAGVELTAPTPEAFAAAVLEGGAPSDGAGLGAVSLLDVLCELAAGLQ